MILYKKPTELQKEFLNDYNKEFGIDIELSNKMIKDNFKYYKKHDIESISSELEKKWYKSLEIDLPDYSVYQDKNYYVDIWCCFVMYSRTYIKHLTTKGTMKHRYELEESIAEIIDRVSTSVIDMGCGLGYSTAGLKEVFANQKVYGYNIKDSDQFRFNQLVSKQYNFDMVGDYTTIGNIDTIFASEYFEHFERPIEHLQDIVKHLNPKYLIIANSFNTKSIGHFHKYKHNEEVIDETKISKRWNNELVKLGYTKLHPTIFNHNPSLFVRNDIKFNLNEQKKNKHTEFFDI